MTLDGMNKYLEDRGFHVTRYRDAIKGVYVFTINKNNDHKLSCEFEYPKSDDWKYKNKCMTEFLERMVSEYENPWGFAIKEYATRDVMLQSQIYRTLWSDTIRTKNAIPAIKNVIFNPPATIVFWADGTKTVVKANKDELMFDPEKGLAMAISKKALGNQGNYFNTIKKWTEPWYNDERNKESTIDSIVNKIWGDTYTAETSDT